MNRAQRRHSRSRKITKHVGHPARQSRARKRQRFLEPDPQEKRVQELNRLMRSELSAAPLDDGEIAGPLAVAAKFAAPELAQAHGLDGEEHAAGVAQWLVGHFGDVIRAFDPAAYLRWRQDCRNRLRDAVKADSAGG